MLCAAGLVIIIQGSWFKVQALDEVGVDWLHTILNEFLRDERIPGDLKESEIVIIYKQKEMLLNVAITEESSCWKLH